MTPMRYRDFRLEITGPETGPLTIRVLGETPGGEMDIGQSETVEFDSSAFSHLVGKVERRRDPESSLYELGGKLGELLFPERVGRLFDASRRALAENEGLRVRLRIQPLSVSALPWEYTHLPKADGEPVENDFLALRRDVSLTRYETIGGDPPPVAADLTRIRILAALASPIGMDALDLDLDRSAISDAYDAVRKELGDAIELEFLHPAKRKELAQALARTEIFHFAGHAAFEFSDFKEGKLKKSGKIFLEDDNEKPDPYSSGHLATALGNAKTRLAVLNGCSTAARDQGGAWTGVAPVLVRENLPAVVAMQFTIRDSNAGQFTKLLYDRLLKGFSIDEAVYEGRYAIYNCSSGLHERDWGVPVLYLRAGDGFLFNLLKDKGDVAPSRTFSKLLNIRQDVETVRGAVEGASFDEVGDGTIINHDQNAKTVEEGGTLKGPTFGKL